MSIASAISNAQAKVAAAYTALRNKGATMPATQNLDNMPTAIASIPSGGGSAPDMYDVMENNVFSMTPGGTFSGDTSGAPFIFKTGHTYKVIVKCRKDVSASVSFFAYKSAANSPNALIGSVSTASSNKRMAEFTYTHSADTDYAYIGCYANNTANIRTINYTFAVYIEDIT